MAEQPTRATDRLAFLLSLVPFLMEHDGISVADVAAHFDVPADRVREAVNLIAMSGIPGETQQYLHGDLFDINWDEFVANDRVVLTNLVAIDDSPRFSAREAAALIAGLQYLSSLPENADRGAIASLMAKLTRGASAAPSQLAVAPTDSHDAIGTIQAAVRAGVQVEFNYLDAQGGHVLRHVDPLRIESVDQNWYLRGWCHLRQAVRTFRLDRMSDLTATSTPAADHDEDVVVPSSFFQASEHDQWVELDLPESALPLIADYMPERAGTPDAAGRMRVSVRVAHVHGLKRLITSLGGLVTVAQPAEARRVVHDWATAGIRRYQGGV
ncbi:helix-turn-helix transcriptional regulator [Cryobacterium tepidiphilum]|uniref:WYL domain-containing protein n=1 Tax=Cryobacterium tepidiphilum TaxID=2486026 RepID=A0A3M8L3R6_9MICO|nr:WYL domain-containing protein [Cryobacterium tepidiphilum]RNE59368.1 WYL domain-containing protein [Cryobacterium tepidiphilum]